LFLGGDTAQATLRSEEITGNAKVTAKGSIGLSSNPFYSGGSFDLTLAENGQVSLSIFTVSGKLVATLAKNTMSKGIHRIIWKGIDYSGQSVASGCYVIKLTSGNEMKFRRFVFAR